MSDTRRALAALMSTAQDGRLEAICERYNLDLVSAFGSAVVGDVDDPSDLDVAVRFETSAERDVLGVVKALSELVGTDRLDVMILNDAGVVARSRALGPGAKGLYERGSGQYALAQMAAMAEEMETAPMRRRDLELLAER